MKITYNDIEKLDDISLVLIIKYGIDSYRGDFNSPYTNKNDANGIQYEFMFYDIYSNKKEYFTHNYCEFINICNFLKVKKLYYYKANNTSDFRYFIAIENIKSFEKGNTGGLDFLIKFDKSNHIFNIRLTEELIPFFKSSVRNFKLKKLLECI